MDAFSGSIVQQSEEREQIATLQYVVAVNIGQCVAKKKKERKTDKILAI